MNIGSVSEETGLPAKTIRYYEEIELIQPNRGANGYRRFTESDLRKLQFLARARSLGFTIDECRALLSLYEDRHRASADVKRLAQEHLSQVARKIAELEVMRDAIESLVSRCSGDTQPDCPILDELAGSDGAL